jgi:copper(I)-binding protein
MSLVNEGAVDDALVSAETDVANTVELHESKIDEEGVMRMSPVPNIPVPAGGSATLQPGGLHVMLMGLNQELAVGDTFNVTLNFEKSGPKTIEVEVRDSMMGQMGPGEGEMDSMSPGDSGEMGGMGDDQE